MSRLSVALRIARRSSARSIGRSALIVGMIAIPVTGMTAAAVVATATIPNTQDTISTKLGHMQGLGQVIESDRTPVSQPPNRPQEAGILPLLTGSPDSGTPLDYTRADAFGDRRVVELYPTSVSAMTATGYASFDATEGAAWMPEFAGRFDVTEGRGAQSDTEVLVTRATLARLGVSVGDQVTLRNMRLDSVTVVGVIDDAQLPDSAQRFYAPTGAFTPRDAPGRLSASTYYFPTEPVTWNDIKALNARGVIVLSRAVLLDPPVGDDVPVARGDDVPVATFAIAGIIGVFAAFEVILLAGAAFTVTARQQQRTLATIASVGAPPSVLRSVVTASGLVLGVVGGVVGAALGIGAAAVFMQLTLDGSDIQYYGFRVPWLLIAGVIAFAVLVGWIAALLPARTAAKLDVVAALRGSRRPPAPNRRAPIAGVVLLIIGIAATVAGGALLAVQTSVTDGSWSTQTTNWIPGTLLGIGPVIAIVGIILCGPLVLRFAARVLGGASLGARLASRDAARNPGRSVPAVAVTLTTIFIAVAAMNIAASTEAFQSSNWSYRAVPGSVEVPLDNDYTSDGEFERFTNVDELEAAVRDSVDVNELAVLSSVRDAGFWELPSDSEAITEYPKFAIPAVNQCPDDAERGDVRCQERSFATPGDAGVRDKIWVGDEKQLALILGHSPSALARDTLADDGVISFYSYPVADGRLTLDWWTGTQVFEGDQYTAGKTPVRSVTVEGIVEKPEVPVYFGYFMSPAAADALDLDYRESLILASTSTMPTDAQDDALNSAVASARGGVPETEIVAMISRPPTPYSTALSWGLLGLSGLIALAAASVAIGLARFDGRQDDATLASLGAPRTARRSFAFWQAIVLTGIGSVVGALLGFALSLAMSQTAVLPFAPPVLQVALVSLGLPVLIGVGAWLTAARAPWVLRVAGD